MSKTNNRAFYIAVATLLSGVFCFGQNSLTGYVRDTHNQPLEFVAVRFLKPDSSFVKSAVTDSIGRYELTDIAETVGLVSFSSLGFRPIVTDVSFNEQDSLTVNIVMQEASYALKEVVVEGQPIIRSENGHITAIPGTEEKRHSFGGYDLLNNLKIPGITVDKTSGEVSALFGNATLYINGIKASAREIKAIRSKDVLRVEYYDAPTGQYIGENAVVNFIIRKYETGGYAEVNGEQKIGYIDGSYNIAGKISHKNSSWQIYGGYAPGEYDADRTSGTAVYNLDNAVITQRSNTASSRVRNDKAYAQVDFTNANNKRTIQVSAYFNHDNTPFNRSTENIDYSYTSGANEHSEQRKETKSRGQKGNAKLHAKFNLPSRQFFELTAQGSYTKNNYSYDFAEQIHGKETTDISNSSQEHLWNTDITLTYGKTFKRGNSIAIKLIDLYKNSRADYQGTNVSRSTLWSNEELFFAQYDQPIGKRTRLMLRPGFSALQYRQRDRTQINLFAPRLNLRLNSALSNSSYIMVSCNIGNSFPNLASMSDAEQKVNAIHVIKGNPDIENTKLYQALLVYGYNSKHWGIQVMAQYQFNHRLPVSCYVADGSRVIESWRTDENAHYINTNISITYRPLQSLSLQLSGGYNSYAYRGYQDAEAGNWDGKFNGQYFIGNFSTNLWVSTPQTVMGMDLAKVKTPWKYGLSVSYALKHWHFEAGIEAPFTKNASYKFITFNPVYHYDNSLISRTSSRHGFLKVAYSFDFGKKIKKAALKPTEAQLESSILKAK